MNTFIQALTLGQTATWQIVVAVAAIVVVMLVIGGILVVLKCYRKVRQGTALVRVGYGGVRVSFNGMVVMPILHRAEIMDISVKRIEIYRHDSDGLICKDNVRADIKVAFFVRVNNVVEDVRQVAQSLGCVRASDQTALIELFDAKFSEALKTVGKQFDFVDLYTDRDRFKLEILKVIGTDLNGYVLDDAAIDYLEQTRLQVLDQLNILDAEGIKKITDLTSQQQIRANEIVRDKEKIIKKQDVEAREVILELERQQAEAEQRQIREISVITSREQAEAKKIAEEQRLKSERARIASDEELGVTEENKQRQILIALRAKQRTDGVETERVKRDQQLEATQRERVVELARIEKEKALEIERKNIQDVIRERVVVERAVVEEEERIKDTHEIATAERAKTVQVTAAEATAQELLVKEVQAAEASKMAATFQAAEILIEAEAQRAAAAKESQGKKMLAEATAAEHAAVGLAEAEVMDAKAGATQKFGIAEAEVVQKKAEAEAAGMEAKARAIQAKGEAEATVMQRKFTAEAQGITEKAEAMKLFDAVGRDHEEFKLELDKVKTVELAQISVRKDIAAEQAKVLGEALKSAKIDIVGGDGQFFDSIVNSITDGKRIERTIENSGTLRDIKNTFFEDGSTDRKAFGAKLQKFVEQFGISSDDVKNLSIAALVTKMIGLTEDGQLRNELKKLLRTVKNAGASRKTMSSTGLQE